MYDKESLHKIVGRHIKCGDNKGLHGPTLPVGWSPLSANTLPIRYLTGRAFFLVLLSDRKGIRRKEAPNLYNKLLTYYW